MQISRLTSLVRVGAAIELIIGLLLLTIPSNVIEALVGPSSTTSSIVARVLAGALLALAVAGAKAQVEQDVALAYIVYNVATVVVLASAGIAGTATGRLLWPVVAVHLILAAALLVAYISRDRRA